MSSTLYWYGKIITFILEFRHICILSAISGYYEWNYNEHSYVRMYCCCSVTKLYPTLCNTMNYSMTAGFLVLHYLLEFAQTGVHWVGDAIQPFHPLLSPSLSVLKLSSIRVFSNELVLCIGWPKYWSFSSSISPPNEYSGLISCKIDWNDLLAVQGTLKSLHQHYNSKASVLQYSAFFMVQLSQPYMTTGITIASIRWTLVSKDFPGGSDSKASVYNVGDPDSSPGLGRSPEEGNGSSLQYYCLENPMDRRAW